MTIVVVSLTYFFEGLQTLHLTIPDYLSEVDVCTKSEQISSTFLRLYIHNNGMDEQQPWGKTFV